jgi:hypothetical protein
MKYTELFELCETFPITINKIYYKVFFNERIVTTIFVLFFYIVLKMFRIKEKNMTYDKY